MSKSYFNPHKFNELFGKNRLGGILLHITSLPNKYGIGDLGDNAYRFIDFLNKFNLKVWQILPFGPTGYGNSPYQCFSTFAGNPLLISPDKLIELNLLKKTELEDNEEFPEDRVDYGEVLKAKWLMLKKAYRFFEKKDKFNQLKQQYLSFCEIHNNWLEDFALFMSLKLEHNLRPWNTWENAFKDKEQNAIEKWKQEHKDDYLFQKFVQFLFFRQWAQLRKYAREQDVKIIGDIPIFVAYDSADVWANPELFYLNDQKEMIYVAGVPPDAFSETGQRWGNPLYNWEVLKSRDYDWWIERIKHNFLLVDFLRIDHFRGFEAYWRIPADEPTAVVGKWIKGPGMDFFSELKKNNGNLPIIAEDLGLITPEVKELLEHTGFPGMRVLQFAFEESTEEKNSHNSYLPHNFLPNSIVYTGTHDNDTTLSWFKKSSPKIKQRILTYFNTNKKTVVLDLIRAAWASVARIATTSLQDLLELDNDARMNLPGTTVNNWEWRFKWEQLTEDRGNFISKLGKLYGRY